MVRNYSCIKERLDIFFRNNSMTFLNTIHDVKKKLLDGTISLKSVKKIDEVLKICDSEEQEKAYRIVARDIASHEISILEYASIFGFNKDYSLPNCIVDKIKKSILQKVRNSKDESIRMLSKEIYAEIRRITEYTTPVIQRQGAVMGYLDKELTITNEHIDMAKRYLKIQGEFVCNKTMFETLMMMVKGELDFETIERMEKEKELINLQKDDKKLDELIAMCEQIIKEINEQTNSENDEFSQS